MKPITKAMQAGDEARGDQIAITDGKSGDEGEVCRVAPLPPLEQSDQRPEHQLDAYQARQNRPYDAQLPEEGAKKAPSQLGIAHAGGLSPISSHRPSCTR